MNLEFSEAMTEYIKKKNLIDGYYKFSVCFIKKGNLPLTYYIESIQRSETIFSSKESE